MAGIGVGESLGVIGSLLVFALARILFEWTWPEIIWAWFWVSVAGLTAAFLTLQGERRKWSKDHIFFSALTTWTFFLSVYFCIIFGGIPQLRDRHVLLIMGLPLFLSQGLMIVYIFGPIQDRVVWKEQRHAREIESGDSK